MALGCNTRSFVYIAQEACDRGCQSASPASAFFPSALPSSLYVVSALRIDLSTYRWFSLTKRRGVAAWKGCILARLVTPKWCAIVVTLKRRMYIRVSLQMLLRGLRCDQLIFFSSSLSFPKG